jgi:hypothetical protein
MPKYVIEREILGIGGLPPAGLQEGAQKSNEALAQLGPQIQWVESYVTNDKTYCIYIAENEDQILQHAKLSGFPASKISEIKAKIDPSTAEG